MDIINFNQTGGFPLTTNILNDVQQAYTLFNHLGALAGNYTIISGCVETGNSITKGAVYIDGEIYPFKGGTKLSKVRIRENKETKQFEDGTTKEVVVKRFVEFGTGVGEIAWNTFKRFSPLSEITAKLSSLETRLNKTVPIGLVALWDRPADAIPQGWVEHIEMKGKAPVGQNSDEFPFKVLGSVIGEKQHSLTLNELPSHRFKYKDIYYSENNGTVAVPGSQGSGDTDYDNRGVQMDRFTDFEGGNQPHNNIQPSRIVRFIRFVGFN